MGKGRNGGLRLRRKRGRKKGKGSWSGRYMQGEASVLQKLGSTTLVLAISDTREMPYAAFSKSGGAALFISILSSPPFHPFAPTFRTDRCAQRRFMTRSTRACSVGSSVLPLHDTCRIRSTIYPTCESSVEVTSPSIYKHLHTKYGRVSEPIDYPMQLGLISRWKCIQLNTWCSLSIIHWPIFLGPKPH